MKLPQRQVECSIAAQTVTVTLRRGGALFEPAVPYVRCDERECQYVDLNQAPCPLRREMFGEDSDVRVGAFLAAQSQHRVCYTCVAESLSIAHSDVRRAAARFQAQGATRIDPRRCTLCQRRRVCFTVIEGQEACLRVDSADGRWHGHEGHQSAPRERVIAFLAESTGSAYCAACVALSTELSLVEAQSLVRHPEARQLFQQRDDLCSGCGRQQTVVSLAAQSAPNLYRVITL